MQKNYEKLKNRRELAARLIDIYIIFNLTFLGLDVYIAHSINAFSHPVEWVAFYFSFVAVVLYALSLIIKQDYWPKCLRFGIGGGAICLGIMGMLFHLNSHFFSDMTLKNLVYTAPFVAPLAFTGIGLLILMNGMIPDTDLAWARWVVLLAGCGWCGNFILSVLDHAQNGFFYLSEWLPVLTSALAIGSLMTLSCVPHQRSLRKFCIVVLGINFIVGILGFFFHLAADLHTSAVKVTDGFLYGAPLFAPLLFPNLSILALFGIWKL